MFTDEDLKRLKTMVLNCEAFYGMNTGLLPIRLSDLINRLEAAEAIFESGHDCHLWSQDKCFGCKAIKAWRKAAGHK